jgi:transcriptional regulator with XRE-family HTH domain
MTATRGDIGGSLLLELALDRARLKERFAAMLIAERTQRGLGRAREYPGRVMAAELGIEYRQYQRWEKADDPSMPTIPKMLAVCEKLERDPAELFGDPEPKPEEEDKFALILEAIQAQTQAEEERYERFEERFQALETAIREKRSPPESHRAQGGQE